MPSADPGVIRPARREDADGIDRLLVEAFGATEGPAVVALVTELAARADALGAHLWVAEDSGRLVGVVGMSDGWIDTVRQLVTVPVLSPLAVAASHRGRGLGARLVQHAVAEAERAGAPAVALEGDPAYYGRLGFEPAADRGVLRPSTAIPEDAFQWRRLSRHRSWMRGRFVYPDVFWRHDAVGLREWRRERHTGLEVTTVTLGARSPRELAQFYARLLGGRVPQVPAEEDWVPVRDLDGVSLAVQLEPDQQAPVWPASPGDQQMQLHLEIRADDLDAAVAHALACGAREAATQPQAEVRVMIDPEGHPFCLWVESDD